jgi:hypothetical protein
MDKIQEIFGDPEKFSPEKIESLIHDTLKFFNELRQKLESSNEKDREEALNIANSLKAKLEEQAQALCQSVGMDPKTLENYINDPANFSSAQWQAMSQAKTNLSDYKEEIAKTQSASTVIKAPKKKKNINNRLIG